MFTSDHQRELFSKLLDKNHERRLAMEAKDYVKAYHLSEEQHTIEDELKGEMGEDAYESFMQQCRAMFAPKQS